VALRFWPATTQPGGPVNARIGCPVAPGMSYAGRRRSSANRNDHAMELLTGSMWKSWELLWIPHWSLHAESGPSINPGEKIENIEMHAEPFAGGGEFQPADRRAEGIPLGIVLDGPQETRLFNGHPVVSSPTEFMSWRNGRPSRKVVYTAITRAQEKVTIIRPERRGGKV